VLGYVWRLPVLKQLRRSGRLNQLLRLGYDAHWGHFSSRKDAESFLRPSRKITYNNEDIAQINIESFSQTHLFDWPVMFFLQRLANEGKLSVVTDLGGHVGVKYLAFRPHMNFPQDLVWQVVDTPAICKEGRRRQSADTQALRFHEKAEDTQPCSVLICSGVLPYLDMPLEQAVRDLPAPPRTIILNKVAVTQGEGFYTLESFGGPGRMPFKITTVAEIERIRKRLGYKLLSHWDIPHRAFKVASAKGTHAVHMVGQAWSTCLTLLACLVSSTSMDGLAMMADLL